MARRGNPEEFRWFITAHCIEMARAARAGSPDVEAEPPRRTCLLPTGPQPAQPFDQHRVGRQRLGAVHQRIEHLVITGGRHREEVLDGIFFGAGVLPPLALERQDVVLASVQPIGEIRVVPGLLGPRDCAVHIAPGPFPTLEMTVLTFRRTFNHGFGS
jgi:hypothetical protein